MKKHLFTSAVLLAVLWHYSGLAVQAGEAESFAKTSTTFGWEVLNDKPPISTLELADGPGKNGKAISLKYQFDEGVWIALVKNVRLSLKNDEAVSFYFKNTGGNSNLLIKFTDSAGAVAGYTVEGGTASASWKEIVAPRSGFNYLYGGSGPQMQWSSLAKMEITLDGPQGKGTASDLSLASFSIVSASKAPSTPKGSAETGSTGGGSVKVKKAKDGSFTIHKFDTTDAIVSRSDQDGTVSMAVKPIIINEKTVKALRVDYTFGEKGIWDAVVVSANIDLSDMKNMSFLFKGTGGENNLQFKFIDGKGAAFGYQVNYPTNIKKWARIVVPKDQFQYLYGGSGAQTPDWAHIQDIELVIQKKDGSEGKGTVNLYNLGYK